MSSTTRRRSSVTREKVKQVWDSFDKPTIRGVIRALAAAGIKLERKTLKTWVRQNFAPTKSGETASQTALVAIDLALPAITKRPEVRLQEFIAPLKELFDARFKALNDMQDETILTLHARTLHMVNITIGEEIVRQRAPLVKDTPSELGTLLRALAESSTAAGDTWTQVFSLRDRTMKVNEIMSSGAVREIDGEIIARNPPSQITGPNVVDPLAFEFAAYDAELLARAKAAKRARSGNGT